MFYGVFVFLFRIVRDILHQEKHILLISLNQHSLQELVSTALRECGSALRFVPVPLRRDREVVLVAVQNDGEALFYAPPELQAGLVETTRRLITRLEFCEFGEV